MPRRKFTELQKEHFRKWKKRDFPDVTHQIDLSELRYLIDHMQNEELSKAFEKLWEAVNQNADHAYLLIKVNS